MSDIQQFDIDAHMKKIASGCLISARQDSQGEQYSAKKMYAAGVVMLFSQSERMKRVKNMTSQTEEAISYIAKVELKSRMAMEGLISQEKEFVQAAKQVAGKVKDASEGLSQGIMRVTKAADFDKLERYVALLERASAAMSALAELESNGKLEKIAAAIK